MAEQKYIQAVYEGRASYLNVFEPHHGIQRGTEGPATPRHSLFG